MTATPGHHPRFPRWLFACCYAASGAAALVYQVAWTRLFTLQLGHSVAASSTVLAAFMGGLAAGAWLAGRASLRPERRLQAYALLEIAIAVVALALPAILHAVTPLFTWAYADGDTPTRFACVRVALSLLVLGLPAAAMGGTFPIAASWFAGRSAADTGILYAANTTGAAVGAICAGFWLIPSLGLRGTTWIGVALNVAAAAGALWLSRHDVVLEPSEDHGPSTIDHRQRPSTLDHRSSTIAHRPSKVSPKPPKRATRAPRTPERDRPRPGLAAAASALSGFLALVYEVIWTRLLALVVGPTTYAFATIVGSFISGIAIGSMAGARLARRTPRPGLWLAAMIGTTSISATISSWFTASRLPLVLAADVSAGATFGSVLFREVLYLAVLLLPSSVAFGAAFPLALATAASPSTSTARTAAWIYSANTVGAVSGALVAGFALIGWLGLQGTFAWMSYAGVFGGGLIAAAVLASGTSDGRRSRAVLACAVLCAALLALLVAAPRWDRGLLSSGAYKYSRFIGTTGLEDSLRAGRLEFYKEGAAGTVSVRRLGGSLALAIDGKVDASNSGDMLTQRMLGLLPVLLHSNPQDILIIGLGSGVTAGSALASPQLRHADIVELSPEVVEASAWFSRENGRVLQSPKVRLLVADGRSHLLLGRRQYDVIVSEPSNPWMAGVAALFTREFFEAARARLKPGGLICQWAHTYQIGEDDLKSIVATFASVFPQGTMWMVGDGDLLLIGSADGDVETRLAGVGPRARAGSIPAVLEDVAIAPASSPFVLLSMFAGGPRELASYGEGASIQTDDRMALEFSAAHAMYSQSDTDNATRIRGLLSVDRMPAAVRSTLIPADAQRWTARGNTALKAQAYAMARDSFRRALNLDTRSVEALRGSSEAAAGDRRLAEELAWLKSLAATEPDNAAVRVELSHVLASTGDVDGAVAAATDASRLEPGNPRPLEQLASIYSDAGDVNRLGPLADTLLARFPQGVASRYYHAAALFLQGRPLEAATEARRIVEADPRYADAQNLLGAACAMTGNGACARAALEAAIQLNPRDPSPYVNLGFFFLQTADPNAAIGYFAEALALDPGSEAAQAGLAKARAAGARE